MFNNIKNLDDLLKEASLEDGFAIDSLNTRIDAISDTVLDLKDFIHNDKDFINQIKIIEGQLRGLLHSYHNEAGRK